MNLSFSKTLGKKAHLAALALSMLASSARGGDYCVAEKLAAASGWHLNWVAQLPFDTDRAKLESLSIAGDLVVATSGDGRVHAYHEGASPLAGTLAWSERIGHATEPGQPADVGPTLVLATRGSNVYAFERTTGERLWADHLGRMPNAAAVEGDNWVYVPYGPLRVLRLTAYPTGRPTSMIKTVNLSATTPEEAELGKVARRRAALESHAPLLLEAGTTQATSIHRLGPYSVAWIGEEGMLVSLSDLENGWKRHELRLGSPAMGDLLQRDEAIYLALSSGDVIRVDSDASGGLSVAWRAALPSHPTGDLLVDGDTLLVSLGVWGLEARSATTGDLLWKRDDPAHLLTAGGGMAWWFDRVGRLVLIDIKDGQTLTTLTPGRFQKPIVNKITNRLYLATHDGVVASLAPAAEVVAEAAESVPAAIAPQQPAAPAEDSDPFGPAPSSGAPVNANPGQMDDSDSDPFGGDPAGDDPFRTPASEDDPFTALPSRRLSPT